MDTIRCVDMIVLHESSRCLVVVKRLGELQGYAWPGGKLEAGETICDAAKRELREETGLVLKTCHKLSSYRAPDRDPRSNSERRYETTLVYGLVAGVPSGELGKTEVLLVTPGFVENTQFILDHDQMYEEYKNRA